MRTDKVHFSNNARVMINGIEVTDISDVKIKLKIPKIIPHQHIPPVTFTGTLTSVTSKPSVNPDDRGEK